MQVILLLAALCAGQAALERELFVDAHALGELRGVRQVLQHPVQRETALHFDAAWEGAFCGYVTVFADGELLRMYYRGLPEAKRDGSDAEVTCYAESRDGVTWTKPELDLFPYGEHARTNIVLAGQAPFSHNFAPFRDTREGVAPEERYKALAGTSETGLFAFHSADGLQWHKTGETAVITEGAFDSQNVAFWSASEKQYVCYLRTWSEGGYKGIRTVSRATSEDFRTWSAPVPMTFGEKPLEHLYTNQTQPYFRKPDLYIATAARFMPGRQVVSEAEAAAIGIHAGYFKDCSDVVLLTSRGGTAYERTFMEGFITPGIGLEHWTSRTNYPACGVVPSGEEEMSVYVQKRYGQPEHHLDRYSLRTDGFIAIEAPYAGGEFTTRVFQRTSASRLQLNCATSAAGSILVEVLNASGTPLEGFRADDCNDIIGDSIARDVRWGERIEIPEGVWTFRFVMKDARLFSLTLLDAAE